MTSNTKGLLVIHLNIRSLPSKIDLLKVSLTYNKPHIITLSETWLNSDISDDEIKLDNYVLFRKDRGTRGGGLLTYVSSNLTAELVVPSVNPQHFIIGNIYKPPNAPAETTEITL